MWKTSNYDNHRKLMANFKVLFFFFCETIWKQHEATTARADVDLAPGRRQNDESQTLRTSLVAPNLILEGPVLVICLKLGYTPNSHFDRENQWTSRPCGLGDILFTDKATRKMVASHHVWTCLDHILSKAQKTFVGSWLKPGVLYDMMWCKPRKNHIRMTGDAF